MPSLRDLEYRSHFLIIKPSIIEEVRRTVIHITRKSQCIYTICSQRYKSNSISSSYSESDSDLDFTSSNSNSSIEKDFIKIKYSSHSKKKYANISNKNKSISTSCLATTTSNFKQEFSITIKGVI